MPNQRSMTILRDNFVRERGCVEFSPQPALQYGLGAATRPLGTRTSLIFQVWRGLDDHERYAHGRQGDGICAGPRPEKACLSKCVWMWSLAGFDRCLGMSA